MFSFSKSLFLSVFLFSTTFNLIYAKGRQRIDKGVVVVSISISGNKITNDRIILRELTFGIGDTLRIEDLDYHLKSSKENIENTQLFNFVTVNSSNDNQTVAWSISVDERWYIWPFPIFEYADRNLSAFLKNGDYKRINYGGYLKIDNFRGMRDQIKIRVVGGYRKQFGLQYFTQNLDKNKRHGLTAWILYQTNHEVPFMSINNRPVYYNSRNGTSRSTFTTDLTYQYRPFHNWYYSFTIGTLRSSVVDTIPELNPNYFGNGSKNFNFSQAKLEITYDKRNSRVFPLSGHLGKLELAKMGLLGSESVNFWSAALSAGYYSNIFKRTYIGVDVMGKTSTQTNLPYFLNEAIGFKDYIRGYEYYVTNGSEYIINKNSVKFEVLPPKVVNLPFVSDSRFKKSHIALYWSIFADTGYVKPDSFTPNYNLDGSFLYGIGTGLYIVAYYDVVFRVEYSKNIFNEWGIFVHFGTPFLNN